MVMRKTCCLGRCRVRRAYGLLESACRCYWRNGGALHSRRWYVAGRGRRLPVAARQALEPRLGASLTAYTVSKAGLAALTVALDEVAQEGILVF
jgi:NAD(P)-dependent dehydrogenase (short-subunit alcohol dehydrogenase family)